MISPKDLPEDKETAKAWIKSHQQQANKMLDAGILGRFFGSTRNAPVYIASFVAILMLISGIVYSFCATKYQFKLEVKDYWAIITPFITTALGFIIGKRMEDNNG